MKITPPRSRTACLLLGSVLAFASLLPRSAAEEPAPVQRAPMIEIEARFVRATPEQMRAAVGVKLDGDKAVMLAREEVEKALTSLKAAKADFFGHSRAVTKSGRKAVIESVRELRYPTDYVPVDGDPTKFLPTAFDTRDVGVVLEFGPATVPSTQGEVDLQLVVSAVNFLGFFDAAAGDIDLEKKSVEELQALTRAALPEGSKWTPVFATHKVTTRAHLLSGQTWLFFHGSPRGAAPPKPIPFAFYLFITPRVIPPK